ncbi:MAG: 3-phosphoshikimate 1-carboxyvinyltransferase [Chloroflexota bacterium]
MTSRRVAVIRGPAPRLSGRVRVPGDKSLSHRLGMLAALAEGDSEIEGFLEAADCLSTLACLSRLGISSELAGGRLRIWGRGLRGLAEPADVLDAGNSGTTLRLLAGILAGQPFLSVLTGDESLRRRPMDRIIQPLREMGAQVMGRGGDRLAPLAIRGGNLRPITYRSPVASAQVKSAVLLAGLYADGPTTVIEPAPSRDHTERLLKGLGVDVKTWAEPEAGFSVQVVPPKSLPAIKARVPGDFSSAAFWLAAAVVHPEAEVTVEGVGLNPTRTGFLDVLRLMGAEVEVRVTGEAAGEPVGAITARSSRLRATEVGGSLLPRLIDEVPLVALVACFAAGTTVIRDAAELRVKESDRLAGVALGLGRLGAAVFERPDGLTITGPVRLTGADLDALGDHRLAMAWAVAGLIASGETRVLGAEAVGISYPDFWQTLEQLAGPVARLLPS